MSNDIILVAKIVLSALVVAVTVKIEDYLEKNYITESCGKRVDRLILTSFLIIVIFSILAIKNIIILGANILQNLL